MRKSTTTRPIQNLALLMAMHDEAMPIINRLQMSEVENLLHPNLPMRCFQKSLGVLNISVLVSGADARFAVDNIGSEAATLMAYEAVCKLKPDLMVSAGTAGGFASRGAKIGTVYLSEDQFIYHDRHVPIAGFDQSAIGKYPALKIGQLAKDLRLPTGVISTGSSLEKNAKDLLVIDQHSAVAKEMEAAAIAWVAMLFNVPVIALKSITNILDESNQSETEFLNNLSFASQSLSEKLLELISYLQNKSIEDLA